MLPGRMKRMKDNIRKFKDGGPGSGIKGHTTAEEASTEKRGGSSFYNPNHTSEEK